MYTYPDRIKMSETDKQRNWTIPAIIDAMQNCVMFQLEDLGVGLDYFEKRNKALVVTCWQVKIYKLPQLFDKITVGTQVYGFKAATALRHCMIWDDENQLAIASHCLGVFIDPQTGHPLKTPSDEWEKFDINSNSPCNGIEFLPKHIPQPKDFKIVEEFYVNIHHLDVNNHMNNAQYVRIAFNHLPDDFNVTQFRVEYKKQATLGDKITVQLFTNTIEHYSTICIALCDLQNKPFALVEFNNN